jgi:hypothetical protein
MHVRVFRLGHPQGFENAQGIFLRNELSDEQNAGCTVWDGKFGSEVGPFIAQLLVVSIESLVLHKIPAWVNPVIRDATIPVEQCIGLSNSEKVVEEAYVKPVHCPNR